MRPPDRIFHYGPPEYDSAFEPLIRPICQRINQSGWLWTIESCEGHGSDNPSNGWGGPRPMLRFACQTEHVGHLIVLLDRVNRQADGYQMWTIPMYADYLSDEEWCGLLTYIDTAPASELETLAERRAVYARLAELAHTHPPKGSA